VSNAVLVCVAFSSMMVADPQLDGCSVLHGE